MARRVNDLDLQATIVEGGILNASTIQKVQKLGAPRQKPADYGVEKGLELRDEINRAFKILAARVADFQKSSQSVIQVRALAEHLFQRVLGFDLEFQQQGIILEGREFKPTLLAGHVPIALTAPNANDDKAGLDIPTAALADGRRKRSASGMLQEFLNADDARLWGFAFDGRVLRLLRDNASLTRPAFIEFDISRIVGETLYSEFSTLWLLCHVTRFQGEPNDCIIEGWKQSAKEDGVVARDKLQANFRAMLSELGNGLLENPRNDALRTAIRERRIDAMQFQGDLLRLAYRVIFLITIEDRGVLHAPDATLEARELYRSGYSLARIRDKALSRVGEARHHDLWLGLRLIFGKLAIGDRAVGLPALGGLFDGRLSIDDAVVSNKRLISALRHLFWMQTPTGVVKVNWKDMETEEFGSVYEGLLELVPMIASDQMSMAYPGDGQTSSKGKKASGNKRKTTGSYYTPDSLVQALLGTTLDPVIDQAVASSDDPVAAILALKVIDPAAGSGHFLLGAARRLAKRIVQIRFDGAETPEDWRHAMREVVRSCIYGVDANPLAIELCKAALWLESVEPGKPLTFLDNRVKLGNSLFGVHHLDLLKKGIPAEAYAPTSSDDKKAATYYRKLNDEYERLKSASPRQYEFDYSTGFDAAVALHAAMEAKGQETISDVRSMAEDYDALIKDEAIMPLLEASNIWTAAWFAPKAEIREKAERSRREVPVSLDVAQMLRGEAAQIPDSVTDHAERLAKTFRFFHWPIEFPTVMKVHGGFDVVVGNPPWEKMKLVEKEFFATLAPDVAEADKTRRQILIADYAAAPEGSGQNAIHQRYVEAKQAADAGSRFVRTSGRFPLTGRGDINLYPLFVEHFRHLMREGGRAGVICPIGIATDKTTSIFFGDLVSKRYLVSLFGFDNIKRIFKSVHPDTPFCLLTMGRNNGSAALSAYLLSVSELADPDRRYALTSEQIARVNPNTKTIPLFRAQADADLTARMHDRVPILIKDGVDDGNPWGLRFTRLFDMTNDAREWFRMQHQLLGEGFVRDGADFVKRSSQGEDRRVPLYEAKMVHHYDPRWATYAGATETEVVVDEDGNEVIELKPRDASAEEKADAGFAPEPRYWVPKNEVDRRLMEFGWSRDWLIGWRDITNATNERTVIAGFIPRVGVGNKYPLMFPEASPRLCAALVANLSSLALDFVARQKIASTSLNYFYMKQFPVLPPGAYSPQEQSFVAERVAKLLTGVNLMRPVIRDLGFDPDHARPEHPEIPRAELDAFFARKYGLSRDDLRYVLDPVSVKGEDYPSETFRGLRDKEIGLYGEYRTARLVLEAWDRMEQESSIPLPEEQIVLRSGTTSAWNGSE
jgi:hypothetical protein